MITLLSRLKEEYRVKLDVAEKKYPATLEIVLNDLKDNEFLANCKFGTILDLRNHCDFYGSSVYDMFNDFNK